MFNTHSKEKFQVSTTNQQGTQRQDKLGYVCENNFHATEFWSFLQKTCFNFPANIFTSTECAEQLCWKVTDFHILFFLMQDISIPNTPIRMLNATDRLDGGRKFIVDSSEERSWASFAATDGCLLEHSGVISSYTP